MAEQLLTVQEAMERLATSRRTLYRLLAEGQIRSIVLSKGSRRIPESEIDRYVRERLESSPKPEAW